MFQCWQSLKVIDATHPAHGRVGRVTSASEYEPASENEHNSTVVVDVLLDGDKWPTTFDVAQVAAIG